MALLFGKLALASVSDRLPTEHELPGDERTELEEERVNALLTQLGGLLPATDGPKPEVPQVSLAAGSADSAVAATDSGATAAAAGQDKRQEILQDANLAILKWLACAGREYGIAYQLGRSLRDTANPPQNGAARDALAQQLSRSRVSGLQEWLSTLAPYLPDGSASIVSMSIGRWCDLTSTIFDPGTPGKLRTFRASSESDVAAELLSSLLPQGDAWINLLVGAESADGLLTPEGWVAAGEAAVSRSARIVRRIVLHYWFVLLILAIAVAAALYFASRDISGAGKVWTQIAAVAAALGVTAKGVTTTMTRLSEDAEKSIFGLEKLDAMAWAVTNIPAELKLDGSGVRALRRAGIPGSSPLGRA